MQRSILSRRRRSATASRRTRDLPYLQRVSRRATGPGRPPSLLVSGRLPGLGGDMVEDVDAGSLRGLFGHVEAERMATRLSSRSDGGDDGCQRIVLVGYSYRGFRRRSTRLDSTLRSAAWWDELVESPDSPLRQDPSREQWGPQGLGRGAQQPMLHRDGSCSGLRSNLPGGGRQGFLGCGRVSQHAAKAYPRALES